MGAARYKSVMGCLLLIAVFAAPLTNSGHPGPLVFTLDDYEMRFENALQHAKLTGAKAPTVAAREKVAESRMKEYPSRLTPRRKASLYARELKAVEAERQRRSDAEQRRVLEHALKK